jgi:hypothetical protein
VTPANQTPPRPGFTGWLRRSYGPWRPVATGATHAECFTALLRVPSTGSTDRVVLEAGRDPNKERRPR